MLLRYDTLKHLQNSLIYFFVGRSTFTGIEYTHDDVKHIWQGKRKCVCKYANIYVRVTFLRLHEWKTTDDILDAIFILKAFHGKSYVMEVE